MNTFFHASTHKSKPKIQQITESYPLTSNFIKNLHVLYISLADSSIVTVRCHDAQYKLLPGI